jgi:hypothetical protein
MIQTKMPVVYGERNGKLGIIKIEARPLELTNEGWKYLIVDWDISADPPVAISSKNYFYSEEKVEEVNNYLNANNDFSGLSKVKKEMKKVQLGLMLDTQMNLLPNGKTIHGLNPEDWEFTPEPITETEE